MGFGGGGMVINQLGFLSMAVLGFWSMVVLFMPMCFGLFVKAMNGMVHLG